MRVLVTGGTGFIGSNLALHLLEQGVDVVITGHDAEQTLPGFTGTFLQPSFLGLNWDAIGSMDAVFHEAAINNTLLGDRSEMVRANVESSRELFERVVGAGCRRIVYASSTAAYGDAPTPYKEDGPMRPLNPYGESKKLLDEFAMRFAYAHSDVVVVGLRYCNVYGPRENHKGKRASMIYQLAQQMVKGNPRLFKHGEQKRDYISIDDVVRANLLAAQATESCVVNCGAGVATSFNTLVEILNKVLGTNRTPEYFDNPHPETYQNHTECDMTLARKRFGFVPEVDIRSGIQRYHESGSLVS